MKPTRTYLILLACVLIYYASGQTLKPWSENAWYWSHNDKPILLLGGSDDDNLFQWPEEELIKQMNRMAAAGGNVIRNTMSDRKDKGFEVYPFLQLADGKYDLNQWNPEYWIRFERMLSETAKRGIFVQIEVWDRFDYSDNTTKRPNRWVKHPYNPANNINYSFEESTFERVYLEHPGKNKQPFFFTTPKQRNIQIVLKYQQQFVDKLLSHSFEYDHVLYCIDNETRAEPEWGAYWSEFIRQKATETGKTVMITEMWDDWNLAAERHRQTFDHPELYDFVDVSQNNHNKGQKHWDNFLYVRGYLGDLPRPMNTTKTYGADGNKFNHTDQDGIERFWRHLLAGAASIRFHRPSSGMGINDKAVASIRAARELEKLIPLWSVEPANHLLDEREENEAYLAADEVHSAFAIYFPALDEKGIVELNLSEDVRWVAQWIDIDQGTLAERELLDSAKARLSPPSQGNFCAAILPTGQIDQAKEE